MVEGDRSTFLAQYTGGWEFIVIYPLVKISVIFFFILEFLQYFAHLNLVREEFAPKNGSEWKRMEQRKNWLLTVSTKDLI